MFELGSKELEQAVCENEVSGCFCVRDGSCDFLQSSYDIVVVSKFSHVSGFLLLFFRVHAAQDKPVVNRVTPLLFLVRAVGSCWLCNTTDFKQQPLSWFIVVMVKWIAIVETWKWHGRVGVAVVEVLE